MRLLQVLLDGLVEVIVAPIRAGRLRPSSWPAGLAPIMVLVGFGYLLALILVLGAPLLIRHTELIVIEGAEIISEPVLTLMTWLVSLTLAIGLTAVLHLHWAVRLVGLILQLAPLLLLVAMPDLGWLALLSVAGIVLFFLIRIRGRFAAWEFPVLWLLVSVGLLGPLRSVQHFGYDHRTMLVQLVLVVMISLGTPALLMAGTTASQIAVSLSQWTGFRVTEVLGRGVLAGITGVLIMVNLVIAGWRTLTGNLGWLATNWFGSVLLIGAAIVVILILRVPLPTRRRGRLAPAEPDELMDAWRRPAYFLSLLMLGPMLVTGIASFAGAFLGAFTGSSPDWLANLAANPWFVAALRLVQAGVAVVLGWRRSVAGDEVTPLVLGSYAALMTLSAASIVTGWPWLVWEPEPVGALLLVVVGVVLIVTRGVTGLHHGLVVALVVSLYRFREVLSEPATLFAISAPVLLVSLLWRVLTDGELARGDSARFPRPARVLVYAALSLLGVLTLAISAQVRLQGSVLDQTPMIALGDRTLGGALYLAALLAALLAMVQQLPAARLTSAARQAPPQPAPPVAH